MVLTGEKPVIKQILNNKFMNIDPFYGSLASAGIGGAVSALGSWYTNKTNKEIARETNKQQVELFREANKYNSMSEQMRRNLEAGVHPMLAAGAQPASAASTPDLKVPEVKNPFDSFDNIGTSLASQFMQDKQLGLQAKNLELEQTKTMVEALKTTADLLGRDLTFPEIQTLMKNSGSMFKDFGNGLTELTRDSRTITSIKNQIRESNVSADEKEYLFGWLDEMQNAQYTSLLAQTENTQVQSIVGRSTKEVNDILKTYYKSQVRVNESQAIEIKQAVMNMREQWRSLFYQGQFDMQKLRYVAKDAKALSDKLQSELKLSQQEADYFIWSNMSDRDPKKFNPQPNEKANMWNSFLSY